MEPPKRRGRPKKVVVITEQNFPSIVEDIKKQVETAQAEFVITVTIEQQTYTGRGTTALEALRNVPMPHVISTGLLVITHGEKRKEMLYPTMQLKRLFNVFHQDVLIHDIERGLA